MIILQQQEIDEVSNILSSCGALPKQSVERLLTARGKSSEQTEKIINQMVKRKLASYDSDRLYLLANKSVKPNEVNPGYIKTVQVLIDLADSVKEYYVQPTVPKTATFLKNDDSEDPVYDIYYIPYNGETTANFMINASVKERTQCFIILDNLSQIEKVQLNSNIEIVAFVLVDADGQVSYYFGDTEEGQADA